MPENNFSTCFYYHNPPEEDILVRTECACMTSLRCEKTKCSFYLPKDKYVWGSTQIGTPMPVRKE